MTARILSMKWEECRKWEQWRKAHIPSFEEGRQRRSSKYHATLESALPGRSNHCCDKILTSPVAPYLR